MTTSWYFQRVGRVFHGRSMDQRGAGKTHLANDPGAIAPTMTFERMAGDTEEMIGWLRKEFGKNTALGPRPGRSALLDHSNRDQLPF
jgi:proline iminopeptidase